MHDIQNSKISMILYTSAVNICFSIAHTQSKQNNNHSSVQAARWNRVLRFNHPVLNENKTFHSNSGVTMDWFESRVDANIL